MKYFMSVCSPSRGGRRTFEMGHITAEYYYGDYLRKLDRVEMQRRFETGEYVRPQSHHYADVYIWGEDISDGELFKRRLSGKLEARMLECPL